MTARGKRERSAARRPWVSQKFRVALKGRNTCDISAFQALTARAYRNQGRHASLRLRLPLALILRAFGALRRLLCKAIALTKC
jgi:hypothetical protein